MHDSYTFYPSFSSENWVAFTLYYTSLSCCLKLQVVLRIGFRVTKPGSQQANEKYYILKKTQIEQTKESPP